MKEKQVAVLLVQDVSVEEAARILGYPRSSVSSWSKQAEKLLEFKGPKTSKTLKGQGRKELFPGVAAIVTYMKDGIRKGNLKTRRLRAIKATVAAWEALNTEVIKRSFEKAIPRYPEVMI
ncbi:hypothetical protein PC116_g28195 [Phytophthora cactorum]|nr:hypothetical protein PC123_g26524 [Phytophthora cactorum]KAG4223338.1 hypothetical protein PC116_g28195 [Phytophthora cactorum]